jgi:hypothetical protein
MILTGATFSLLYFFMLFVCVDILCYCKRVESYATLSSQLVYTCIKCFEELKLKVGSVFSDRAKNVRPSAYKFKQPNIDRQKN